MIYKPKFTDYDLSPFTGMTRESWIDAAKYLLEGVFSNIGSYDSPIVLPRTEFEITYPHKNSDGAVLQIEQMAQKFEGLARTFFIAAPLIHAEPDVEICGFNLREYYSKMILRSCTKGDKHYVGSFKDLYKMLGTDDPSKGFQQTIESGILVVCLDSCREEIWERYSKDEKDTIAQFISSFAYESTSTQNWRLMNMLDMAFLHKEGYKIKEEVMLEHAQAILSYYSGDGWYRDGHAFDYYSCWSFNVYTTIWNKWYGYKNLPYFAKKFEDNSNELMKTYPDFFDKDGFTIMWGRSSVYRCAATSALSENFNLNNPTVNPGLARRIMSGSLLQFLQHDKFLINGVPSMGFYGKFSPLIQGYSCAESVYWLAKCFLCLLIPKTHNFWNDKEVNGSWDKLGASEVKETTLNGPALCFTNHNANGSTILRTGKVIRVISDNHGIWNYAKLAYNSKYPWEATPTPDTEAMQYVLTSEYENNVQKANVTCWIGEENGVLYRRQFFDCDFKTTFHWCQAINLADFPIEYGIVRADKLRLCKTPIRLTLGSYGFPDNDTEVVIREKGSYKAIILKGYDSMGRKKQMAMTIYDGWDKIDIIHSEGTNPDSEKSIVIYASTVRRKKYGYEKFILISQTITKESHEDFSDDEIFAINKIDYEDKKHHGGYGNITIYLNSGDTKIISFDGIESKISI